MLKRETTYKMAGRKHEDRQGADPHAVIKKCELRLRAGQGDLLSKARAALVDLAGLEVDVGPHPHSLYLTYNLLEHTQETLEEHLMRQGLQLDTGVVARLKRAFAHFSEDTQRRNLLSPQRLIKQSNEVYMSAYDQHQHGDRDETPQELREYK